MLSALKIMGWIGAVNLLTAGMGLAVADDRYDFEKLKYNPPLMLLMKTG